MMGGGKNPSAGGASVVVVTTAASFSDSLDDTALAIAGKSIVRVNPLSSLRLSVAAGCNSITAFVANNEVGVVLADKSFAVYLDGALETTWTSTEVDALDTFTLALDGAAHTLEIVNGWQQYGTTGAWIYAVSSRGGPVAALANPTVSRRLAVYGDSLALGGLADSVTQHGWIGLLRGSYPGRVSFCGWGGRSLFGDSTDIAGLASHLVGLCFTATTKEIWEAIGYNDYWGPGTMSAEDFGDTLADLYDAIHALAPTATIYAQTPIITGAEASANGLGYTIGDYRTAKAAAAVGRAWVTVVDGTALMAAGGLTGDGIHPSTAGHATLAASIATALGVT